LTTKTYPVSSSSPQSLYKQKSLVFFGFLNSI
jgi:hypothetical protein